MGVVGNGRGCNGGLTQKGGPRSRGACDRVPGTGIGSMGTVMYSALGSAAAFGETLCYESRGGGCVIGSSRAGFYPRVMGLG